jgi:hypothetical protein
MKGMYLGRTGRAGNGLLLSIRCKEEIMKKIVLAMKSLIPVIAIAILLAQGTANAQVRLADECPPEGALRSLFDT